MTWDCSQNERSEVPKTRPPYMAATLGRFSGQGCQCDAPWVVCIADSLQKTALDTVALGQAPRAGGCLKSTPFVGV